MKNKILGTLGALLVSTLFAGSARAALTANGLTAALTASTG